MPKDTRYLKRDKKSGIYIFQKRVSDSVAGLLGMKNNIYNKSLGTDSLREAQGLRHSHLAYLKKLEDAESVNPSYQSVMDKYKLMDHGRLEHEFGVLSDELSTTYRHLGNPEWEDLSEQKKNASALPVSITEKDDIEYRVLASLTGRDPEFKPPEKYRLRLKDALDKHSSERDSKFSGWKEGEDGMQHTSREMFVIPLIKAVQELSAQVDTLKAEIKELKNE